MFEPIKFLLFIYHCYKKNYLDSPNVVAINADHRYFIRHLHVNHNFTIIFINLLSNLSDNLCLCFKYDSVLIT